MSDHLGASATISRALYSTAVDAALPAIRLYLWQRALLGIDRWDRVHERLGHPSLVTRPKGPVFWFHAASIGECAIAVALVERCLQQRPYATLLFTTQDTLALSFIERSFPKALVICQYAPIDTSRAVDTFLRFWRPHCVILMESELWPNLLLSPRLRQVKVGILNARMSLRSFKRWSTPAASSLASAMLSRATLVTTPSSEQGVQFQLLGANPMVLHYTGDLKFATQRQLEKRETEEVEKLRHQIGRRPMWLAASTHPGEEEVVARIHLSLLERFPSLLTIIVPRHPHRRQPISKMLGGMGLVVSLRSSRGPILPKTQVHLADTTGEMGLWYTLSSLVFVGGSMVPGIGGHNLSEAAYGSCAVLVGPYMGNFQEMVEEMDRTAPLSVWQVADEADLRASVEELLGNEAKLNARCIAAKRAATVASDGVVSGVFDLLNKAILSGSEPGPETEEALREDGPDAELSPILHKRLLRTESDRPPPRSEPTMNGNTKRQLHPMNSFKV